MKIFSLSFWATAMMSTIITMICIYLIKKANANFRLPIVSDVVETV